MQRRLTLLWLAFIMFAPVHVQADSIELITLQHRMAEDIMPLIQPVLQPGDAMSGSGSQLILRASPATQAQVQRLLQELDRTPRNLVISVRSDDEMRAAREGVQGRVIVHPEGVSVNGRIKSSHSSQDNNATQQIRVLEGSPARLRVGRETPYAQPVWVETPNGMQRIPATAIRETGRWLNVAPTLQGEQVLLDIQPESAQINPQHPRSTNVQSLSTRVRVPLGQWVPLGGVDSREQQQINGRTNAQSQSNQIWVKVELAD